MDPALRALPRSVIMPPHLPATSPAAPTLLGVPLEVRLEIYKTLFRDSRLVLSFMPIDTYLQRSPISDVDPNIEEERFRSRLDSFLLSMEKDYYGRLRATHRKREDVDPRPMMVQGDGIQILRSCSQVYAEAKHLFAPLATMEVNPYLRMTLKCHTALIHALQTMSGLRVAGSDCRDIQEYRIERTAQSLKLIQTNTVEDNIGHFSLVALKDLYQNSIRHELPESDSHSGVYTLAEMVLASACPISKTLTWDMVDVFDDLSISARLQHRVKLCHASVEGIHLVSPPFLLLKAQLTQKQSLRHKFYRITGCFFLESCEVIKSDGEELESIEEALAYVEHYRSLSKQPESDKPDGSTWV